MNLEPKDAPIMAATPPLQSVKSRMLRGFAWVIATRLLVGILTFASSIVLARLLAPEDFGLVALAIGVSAVVTAFTSMPIAEALIRTSEPDEEHFATAFTLGFTRSTLLAITLALAAWPAAQVYEDSRLIPILLLLAMNAFITGFYSPRWPMIQKQLSFGPAFVMETTCKTAAVLASVVIAYVYRSFWAIVLPITLSQVLSAVITYLYAPYRLRFSLRYAGDIWSFSVWMTLSSILNTITTRIDTLLIGGLLGQKATGYYSYGDDKASLPTREISASLVPLLFPGLAAVREDPARLRSAYKRIQTLIFAVCAPVGVGLALIAPQFVHLLLGDKWAPIIPIIQIIAVTLALENLSNVVRPLAMAQGRTRALFVRDALVFACRTPGIVLGLLLFGIPGVLAARVFATLVSIGVFLDFARRLTSVTMREQLGGCARSLAALVVMAIGVGLFQGSATAAAISPWAVFVSAVSLGAVLYAATHMVLWSVSGRPQGPESEILKIVQDATRRFMPS